MRLKVRNSRITRERKNAERFYWNGNWCRRCTETEPPSMGWPQGLLPRFQRLILGHQDRAQMKR